MTHNTFITLHILSLVILSQFHFCLLHKIVYSTTKFLCI